MATILLLGPKGAGKTTFALSAQGIQQKHDVLMDHTTAPEKISRWNVGGGSIRDTPGQDSFYHNTEKLYEAIYDDSYIAFIFRVNEFLEELKHPERGGDISSDIKNFILPTWNKFIDNEKPLFFIGTHIDKVKDDSGNALSGKEIEDKVRKAICNANEKYKTLTKGHCRYPFFRYFEEGYGRFFCIDTTNIEVVKQIIKKIFNSK